MIYYSIPYDVNKNIGKYYNDFMSILPNDDDFACFVDGDTIFTTPNYGHVIDRVIKEYPEIGCFTAKTNRVSCKWQVFDGVDVETNDIAYHRELGGNLQDVYDAYCEDVTDSQLMSGLLILINKKTWFKIGGFLENGMLGVDNELHRKLIEHDEKLYVMKGIYLYHWYRWPDKTNTTHLK